MGLLFRNQVHNSLFAQFCPNFLMLRNCYKSASHSFYGYFPNTRAAFLWKRSHGFFSDQWERSSDIVLFTNQWERSYDIVLFTDQWERSYDIVFLPTNEMEAMKLFFYQPIWKKTHIAPCRANRDHGELFKTICSTRTLCLWDNNGVNGEDI